jgi:hypothetical protein
MGAAVVKRLVGTGVPVRATTRNVSLTSAIGIEWARLDEDAAPEARLRTLVASGILEVYANHVLEMFAEVCSGAPVHVTNAVERITRHPPRDLAEYARDYREHFDLTPAPRSAMRWAWPCADRYSTLLEPICS